MSKRKKKIAFIRQNQVLSVPELSSHTGLSEAEVNEVLLKIKSESISSAAIEGNDLSRSYWTLAGLLFLVVIVFYIPVLNNEFVNWDDRQEIYENPNIFHLNLQSLYWMLTNYQTYWMPLTWLSWALNYQMGGLDPKIFHFTNVLLHAFNTSIVFFISLKILSLGGSVLPPPSEKRNKNVILATSILAALLFGLHPIHVESVAWAAERKDVLYSLFYLLGIWFYLDFASSETRKNLKMAVCFGFLMLSLMSKPMAISLPIVFLVLDYWPLRRLQTLGVWRVLTEKILFFTVVFSLVWISLRVRMPYPNGEEWFWIMNGFRSIVFYLYKMVLPFNLTPFYAFPHLITDDYLLVNYLAIFAVLAASIGLFLYRRQRPYLLTAWLYYLVVLAPVSGFIRTGSFAAADRYAYLSSIGIFLPFSAWVVPFLFRKRIIFWGFVTLMAVFLGFTTVKQIGIWKNSETFWESCVNAYPDDNPNALTNLGFVYLKEGRVSDAIEMFNRAVVIPPPMAFTHEGMGDALVQKDQLDEAIQQYEIAIQLQPNVSSEHRKLASALEKIGRNEEATAESLIADRIDKNVVR